MQDGETYRKDPPPLFHRNGVRHPLSPPFPSPSLIVLVVVLVLILVVVVVVVSSLRLESLSLFPFLSHPRSICLAPSEPPSHSFLVSDRVPLFRVLYYFFYQSARFQDALRPVESCVINHEM